jgi:hypothetical protein
MPTYFMLVLFCNNLLLIVYEYNIQYNTKARVVCTIILACKILNESYLVSDLE